MQSFRLAVSILVMLVTSGFGVAAEPPQSGSVGLMATIQTEQLDILVPVWASQAIMVAPAVRIVSVGDAYTDIGLGTAVRFYRRSESVSPYVGVRGMALFVSPIVGNGWTDFVLGGMFGGDYFLSESFSVGVEAQLNVTKSDDGSTRFGNPGGTNLNTAAGVFVSVYF